MPISISLYTFFAFVVGVIIYALTTSVIDWWVKKRFEKKAPRALTVIPILLGLLFVVFLLDQGHREFVPEANLSTDTPGLTEAGSETALPSEPVSTPLYFGVGDANEVTFDDECNYAIRVQIDEDSTAHNLAGTQNPDGTVTCNLDDFQEGVIVGNAIQASVNGDLIDANAALFLIDRGLDSSVTELTLYDGAFYIVHEEDAQGFLQLRQRYLNCLSKYRTVTYIPESARGSYCVKQMQRVTPPTLSASGTWVYDCLVLDSWVGQDFTWADENWAHGPDARESVEVLIPPGASSIDISCGPCEVTKPDGETRLLECPAEGFCFGPDIPNYQAEAEPGDVFRLLLYGVNTCNRGETPTTNCTPEVYITVH